MHQHHPLPRETRRWGARRSRVLAGLSICGHRGDITHVRTCHFSSCAPPHVHPCRTPHGWGLIGNWCLILNIKTPKPRAWFVSQAGPRRFGECHTMAYTRGRKAAGPHGGRSVPAPLLHLRACLEQQRRNERLRVSLAT